MLDVFWIFFWGGLALSLVSFVFWIGRRMKPLTLRQATRRAAREALKNNPTTREYRHGWLKNVLQNKWLYIGFGAISIILLLLERICPNVKDYTDVLPDSWKDGAHTAYAGIIGAQAVLIGFIVPFSIALLGVIFGQRLPQKYKLRAFVHEALVIPLTYSSLLLIGLMTVHIFFGLSDKNSFSLAALILHIIWFVGNTIWIGRFIRFALQYMNPRNQLKTVKYYVRNVIWPNELRYILSGNIFRNILHRISQGGEPESLIEGGRLASVFSFEGGQVEIPKKFSKPRFLANVYILPLWHGCKRWQKQVRALDSATSQEDSFGAPTRQRLVFHTMPFSVYEGEKHLCSHHGALPLDSLSQIFVRWAFRFKVSGKSDAQIRNAASFHILQEIAKEAMIFVEQNDYNGFNDSIDRMGDMHVFLLSLGDGELSSE